MVRGSHFVSAAASGVTLADRTLAAYADHARTAIANWSRFGRPSRFLRRFAKALPPGARVLDYGCGIGTDLAWLAQQGCAVEGIDGTSAFVWEARRRCPGAPVTEAQFETVALAHEQYDGIWCQAALIHLVPGDVPAQLEKLRMALKPGGLLGVSFAWGHARRVARHDWIPGRYIACYRKTAVFARFRRGWTVEDCRVVSRDGRAGRWIQMLARKKGPGPF